MAFSGFARDPQVAETVGYLGRRLIETSARRARETSERQYDLLSEGEIDLAYRDVSVRPSVVFGAAVVLSAEREHPALLVNSGLSYGERLPPGELISAVELTELRFQIERALEADLPANVQALPVPEPQPSFAPAEGVRAPIKQGTLGARVTTENGVDAILTAGHVATAGTFVRDQADHSGQVIFSIDPAQVPAFAVTADVAVIRADCWNPHMSPVVAISGQTELRGGQNLTMHGVASGVKWGTVMGRSPFIYVPSMSGQWVDCYFTTRGISQEGDSGAPVLRENTGDLVGHLVGGSGVITSYIQAIEPQLVAAGVRLRNDTE